nr:extensin-like [Aegilops tauschii subsp. strangulata]
MGCWIASMLYLSSTNNNGDESIVVSSRLQDRGRALDARRRPAAQSRSHHAGPAPTPSPWTSPPDYVVLTPAALDCTAPPLHRRSPGQPPLPELFYQNPLAGSAPPVNLLLVVLSVDGLVPVLRLEQRCPSPYGPVSPSLSSSLSLTASCPLPSAPVRALARPCGRAPALALALVRPSYSPLPASPACSPHAGAPAHGRGLPPPP